MTEQPDYSAQPYASVRVTVDIPGEVPDGTYVTSRPVYPGENLRLAIVDTAARTWGSIATDRITRAVFRAEP